MCPVRARATISLSAGQPLTPSMRSRSTPRLCAKRVDLGVVEAEVALIELFEHAQRAQTGEADVGRGARRDDETELRGLLLRDAPHEIEAVGAVGQRVQVVEDERDTQRKADERLDEPVGVGAAGSAPSESCSASVPTSVLATVWLGRSATKQSVPSGSRSLATWASIKRVVLPKPAPATIVTTPPPNREPRRVRR